MAVPTDVAGSISWSSGDLCPVPSFRTCEGTTWSACTCTSRFEPCTLTTYVPLISTTTPIFTLRALFLYSFWRRTPLSENCVVSSPGVVVSFLFSLFSFYRALQTGLQQAETSADMSPNNSSAGVLPVTLFGVLRYRIKKLATRCCKETGCPPYFLSKISRKSVCFRMPTAGWYGGTRVCFIPVSLQKDSNTVDVNCGPLSLTSSSGSPYAANSRLKISTVFCGRCSYLSGFSFLSIPTCFSKMHLRSSPGRLRSQLPLRTFTYKET